MGVDYAGHRVKSEGMGRRTTSGQMGSPEKGTLGQRHHLPSCFSPAGTIISNLLLRTSFPVHGHVHAQLTTRRFPPSTLFTRNLVHIPREGQQGPTSRAKEERTDPVCSCRRCLAGHLLGTRSTRSCSRCAGVGRGNG